MRRLGRPPGQATGRGRTITEASVSFVDQPEVRYTQSERRSIVESKVSVPGWGPYAHADA